MELKMTHFLYNKSLFDAAIDTELSMMEDINHTRQKVLFYISIYIRYTNMQLFNFHKLNHPTTCFRFSSIAP